MQMFNKSFLVNKIVNSLLTKEYQVLLTQGSFDIAAKKEDLFLIKVLMNIDGLDPDQASSLKVISYFLSAYPFVVSIKTNREVLNNDIIYSRFGLSVVTPQMFDGLTNEEISAIQSAKGRHTIDIDNEILRKRRNEMGFSLEELSKIARISKKALYEIENKRVNPSMETVEKLESILRVDLKLPYKMKTAEATYLKPKNEFQREVSKEFTRIGIDNSSVYSAPFELIGKENFSIITNLSTNTVKIKREVGIFKKLSSVFSSKAVFIAKKSHEKNVEGIPVFLDTELPDIESSKELSDIIKEKTE